MKKTLILALFITTAMAVPVWAHCGRCGVGDPKDVTDMGSWADKKVDMMKTNLDLTDEQAGQIKAAIEAKKAKKQAAADEYQAQLKTILTPEQWEKHEAKMEMKGGMMHGHAHDHGEKME